MKLADFSIKHPAIIGILLFSLLVFAGLSYVALNREMIPAVGLPGAIVVTAYPGASAREIERTVTKEIENQLSALAGMSSLESTSSDSYSMVSMDFRDGVDVYEKLPQIRELLNAIRDELPEGIRGEPEIIVTEASGVLPIFSVRIDASMDRVALAKRLDEDLVPRLARIPGVSKVNVQGEAKRRVRVELDLARLEARGISLLRVYEALRYANRNLPAGGADWRGDRLSLTTRGAFRSIEEAAGVAVGAKDGAAIYLGDVASISFEDEPPEFRILAAGKDVVVVDLLKRDDGNTIEIVKAAKAELDAFSARLGGTVGWKTLTDQAVTTEDSLAIVVQSALMGTLLSILVILLFLHDWRATLIVGGSIPVSTLITIVGMRLAGQTLNLLSLAGITVAIGMIVDASIVIIENTWDWYLKEGNRKLAASRGADEVGGAVLASTVTTVVVFVPLIFLTGIIGIVMKDLSLTIVFALAASALYALVVVPFLSTKILREGGPAPKPAIFERLEGGIDRAVAALEAAYARLLRRALGDKAWLFGLSTSVLAASVLLLGILPVSFIPPTDTGEFEIHVRMPAGYSLARSAAKMTEVESLVSRIVPETDAAVYYAGASSSLAIAGAPDKGFGRVRLLPAAERDRSVHELIPLVREAVAREVPDVEVAVVNGGFDALLALATGGQGYRLSFYGTDVDLVAAAARTAKGLLEQDPDVVSAELGVDVSRPQLYADLSQRSMATLGVTPHEAGTAARLVFTGLEAGQFAGPEGDLPIVVTTALSDHPIERDVLDRISLVTSDGRSVRFAAFSELRTETGISTITKKNRAYTVELVGYLKGEDQGGVSRRMTKALGALALPPGVGWEPTGTSELIGDSMRSLLLVLGIAIFLVYAVMVIQFERYAQPLVIMASVPFCLIGVTVGLLAFGSALSIIAMLALITLGGTVVNNAIVMVDFTNLLRRRDLMELREATVAAAASRLKPILMTTLTTIVGVIPMALAKGDGSEVYAPLGQAILGGLTTSTLITLFVVPSLYEAVERRVHRMKEKRGPVIASVGDEVQE